MRNNIVVLSISVLGIALSVLFFSLKIYFLSVIFAIVAVRFLFFRQLTLQRDKFELRAELEKQQAERENDRLSYIEETQKIKETTRDTLENFRSTLSHQLRMPLSIVQGYADLLARDMVPDDETQKNYLGKIVEHSSLMGNVLSTQFSANRSFEKIIPVFSKIDIINLIHQTGNDMQSIALSHGIHIQTLSTHESLIIDADVIQLNKIFFNLLENSIKYMGREGLVTIYTDCDDDNVVITVTDNGLGLPAEETSHIFEYSYQGSNKAGGNGHGLFYVKKATEVHGGTISATSAPGMGMSIRISLPLHQTEQVPIC